MAKASARTAPAKKAAAATPAPAPEPEAEESAGSGGEPEAQSNDEPILIHDELLDLARALDKSFADQSSKEADADYFARLLTAIGDADDATFDALSEGAQTWFNEQGAALNDSKPLSAPEGFVSKKAAAGAGRKAPAKAAAGETAPRKAAAKKERGPSKTMDIRLDVCRNPDITLADLTKKHPDSNSSTVSTIRSDVLASIQAVKTTGHWKD